MPALYFVSVKEGGQSYYLRGRPGGGKSFTLRKFPQMMKKVFPDKEFGIVIINGATLTMSSALGYMWPEDAPSGRKRSTFTEPFWQYTKEGKHLSEYDGGIILVDDAHMMDPDLKKIMGEGAYDKVLANHRLPSGWVIWFAGNRAEDRAGATRDFDHLITRRNQIDVTDDPEGFVEVLRELKALPETIEFADKHPMVVYMTAPEEQGPYCNPRTLTQTDAMLQTLMETFGMDQVPTDTNVVELVQGGIGRSAAEAYMKFVIEGHALPKYADIIKDPERVEMPPRERPDLWRLQAYKLAKDVKVKDAEPAMTYMSRFPEEFQVLFVKAAYAYKPEVAMTPKFGAWCKKKSALVGLLTVISQG